MRYKITDEKYKYEYYFDTKNGIYLRTGILDNNGKDTGVDPFMGNFPHLIDIGVMGHCIHGRAGLCIKAGVECYQDGLKKVRPNMTVEDFEWIINQCRFKTNQVALGGRGDPDQHESFEELLKICRKNNIIPSYTTSGLGMNNDIAAMSKKYCGAVAVSWYRSDYTKKAINTLHDYGVKVSIHYVLSNSSLDEAIDRLKNQTFPKNINAIIFLLHKPKGLGTQKNVINIKDPRFKEFMELIDNMSFPFQIGFDSCTIPGILNSTKNILPQTMEPCEGGRFSCYISSEMNMTPCSFDTEMDYGAPLKDKSISEIWNGENFNKFRNLLRNRCPNCKIRTDCMGGCPLMPEIVLCDKENKEIKI